VTAPRAVRFVLAGLALLAVAACKPPTDPSAPLFFEAAPEAPEGMVLIPAGPFTMGSDKIDTEGRAQEFGAMKPWFMDEHPSHVVNLPSYFMDVTEVTNAAYALYLEGTGAPVPKGWSRNILAPENRMKPVTGVNWFESDAYCRWLGKRLPTEAEWEKAARGTDAREFPWGNTFDANKGNTGATRLGAVTPVGQFPEGKSPYGLLDMAGNVWEWTDSWYQPYPGTDYTSKDFGKTYKVIRGGGWGGVGHYTLDHFYRSAYRFYIDPSIGFNDAGFRCAKPIPAAGPPVHRRAPQPDRPQSD
jgi:formylglycine-generating enzyme required for sulfatase activity